MPRPAGLTTAVRLCLWTLLSLAFYPGRAAAQDVTLTSRDGGVEVSGTLLSFDGEFYRIDSVYGVLTLDGTGVACSGPGCPDLSTYVADLSFSGPPLLAQGLLPVLIQSFATYEDYAFDAETRGVEQVLTLSDRGDGHAVARFRIEPMADAEAFASFIASQTDFVLASRAVLPAEAELAEEAGFGPLNSPAQTRVLALDAIVPVVSPRNPLDEITVDQLAQVFSGEIDNWQVLGGVDEPIFLHLPSAEGAIRAGFLERIMLPLNRSLSSAAASDETQGKLLQAVARDPFAIGLARLSQASGVRVLALSGRCGFTLHADDETLKTEDYPLPLPLFLYQRQGRLPRIAREFLRFAGSPAGQIAVLRAGFIDQSLTRTTLARQGDRLANGLRNAGQDVTLGDLQAMVEEMQHMARLSLSFRFDGGISGLDAQSRANVTVLADALETGTIGGHEMVFVGFTDTVGTAAENRALSLQRAEAVRDAVLNAALTFEPGQLAVRVAGFGEALPLTCEETPWGKYINRRVEVWIR